MSKYNEDLDYLYLDEDISTEELEEIISEAEIVISNANSEKDKLIEAYLKMVQCLQKLEKGKDSKEFIDKLLKLNPNMPEMLLRLGMFYYDNKEYDTAIEKYEEAILESEDKIYPYASLMIGNSYWYKNDYEKAIENYKIAIENKPNYSMAYNNCALTYYYKLHNYKEAIESYKKAIELNPNNNGAFSGFKNLLLELEKDKKGLEDAVIISAKESYYKNISYSAFERLHSAFDGKKSPDFDKAVVYFLSNICKKDIKLVEYYLLMSSMEYLYYEAPDDEQNLFMVLELIDAGTKEESWHESDLDRLFGMLKEKNAEHIAVKHYEKFNAAAGNRINDIIKSCRKHFAAIGNGVNIFKYVRENYNEYNIDASANIEIFAKIIMRTFAKNKPNPHENLFNYLYKLYKEKEDENVKYTDIHINIDEVIELKKFYDGCAYDEDDSKEDLGGDDSVDTDKIPIPDLSVRKESPESKVKKDLETMKQHNNVKSFDSIRESVKTHYENVDYDKVIEESQKIIDAAIKELYNIESEKLEKNKTNRYFAHINLGEAFLVKAVKESNAKDKKEYYENSFKQYAKAKELAINDEKNIYNKSLGVAYMYREEDDDLENAAKCFTKAKVDISILPKLKNTKSIDIAKIMLDDNIFFSKTTENCTEEEKNTYKSLYIKSLEIMSELQIQNQTEMPAAYYTTKVVSEKLLFDNEPFHLNSIKTSNDPEEGKTLFRYLFPKKEIPLQVEEFIAFAGCFTFNNDCLNQFRLYGKTNNEEGTGVSIAFNEKFFNENICTCVDTKVEDDNNEINSEPLPLFRCIYIDPDENNVVSLGQKEEYVFYREGKGNEYETYKKEIEKSLRNVNAMFKDIQDITKKLENGKIEMAYKLLLNLRYLIKHVAFKEEQECRIIQVKKIAGNNKIQTDSNNRLYIKYLNLCKDSVEKICFGPRVKDKDKEVFKQFLVFKENGFKIDEHIKHSTSPLA